MQQTPEHPSQLIGFLIPGIIRPSHHEAVLAEFEQVADPVDEARGVRDVGEPGGPEEVLQFVFVRRADAVVEHPFGEIGVAEFEERIAFERERDGERTEERHADADGVMVQHAEEAEIERFGRIVAGEEHGAVEDGVDGEGVVVCFAERVEARITQPAFQRQLVPERPRQQLRRVEQGRVLRRIIPIVVQQEGGVAGLGGKWNCKRKNDADNENDKSDNSSV